MPDRLAGEANDAKGMVQRLRETGSTIDRHPDLERRLRRHLVEPEGRQKADDSVGDPLAGGSKPEVRSEVGVGKDVEAPPHLYEEALVPEPTQVLSRDAVGIEVTGPEHDRFPYESESPLLHRRQGFVEISHHVSERRLLRV